MCTTLFKKKALGLRRVNRPRRQQQANQPVVPDGVFGTTICHTRFWDPSRAEASKLCTHTRLQKDTVPT